MDDILPHVPAPQDSLPTSFSIPTQPQSLPITEATIPLSSDFIPTNNHPMLIRAKNNIRKPIQKMCLTTKITTTSPFHKTKSELRTVTQTLMIDTGGLLCRMNMMR